MVTVKITSTVYYGPRGDKRRYGPGDAVLVPEGLARALGLLPAEQDAAASMVEERTPAPKPAVRATPARRPRKAR